MTHRRLESKSSNSNVGTRDAKRGRGTSRKKGWTWASWGNTVSHEVNWMVQRKGKGRYRESRDEDSLTNLEYGSNLVVVTINNVRLLSDYQEFNN
jgi:hypothetical protein